MLQSATSHKLENSKITQTQTEMPDTSSSTEAALQVFNTSRNHLSNI